MRTRKPADPLDQLIGRNIRFHRKSGRRSLTEVGQKLGVTYQQIQKYENGTNRVPGSRLVHIARILDVPVEALLGEDADHMGKKAPDGPCARQAARLTRAIAGCTAVKFDCRAGRRAGARSRKSWPRPGSPVRRRRPRVCGTGSGFAVNALRSDVPSHVVQRWLGHASLRATTIYGNVIGPEERAFAKRDVVWFKQTVTAYEHVLNRRKGKNRYHSYLSPNINNFSSSSPLSRLGLSLPSGPRSNIPYRPANVLTRSMSPDANAPTICTSILDNCTEFLL
jgi:hypothetical protein